MLRARHRQGAPVAYEGSIQAVSGFSFAVRTGICGLISHITVDFWEPASQNSIIMQKDKAIRISEA
jgi:hypothetical protein